jgi:DDE superfamily endonuclease
MSARLAYRTNRSNSAQVFQIKAGAYDTDSLIEFRTDLHAHFDADPVTLVWDGLPSHRSKAMTPWLADQRSWLTVERLPCYAPDLNPVELLWGNIEGVELAKLVPGHHPTGSVAGSRRCGPGSRSEQAE